MAFLRAASPSAGCQRAVCQLWDRHYRPAAPPLLCPWRRDTPPEGRTHPSRREPLIPHASQVRPSLKTPIIPVGSPRLRTSPAGPRAPEDTNPGDMRVSSRMRTTGDQRGLSTGAICTELRHLNKLPSNSTNSPHRNRHPPPPPSPTLRLPLLPPTSSPLSHPTRPLCPPRSPRQNQLSITQPKGRVSTSDRRSRPWRLLLTFCPSRRDRKLLQSPSHRLSPLLIQPPLHPKRPNTAPHPGPLRWIQSAIAWIPALRCSSKRKGQNCCHSWRSETRTLRCGWREVRFPPHPLSYPQSPRTRAALKVGSKTPVPLAQAWRISVRPHCQTRRMRSQFLELPL